MNATPTLLPARGKVSDEKGCFYNGNEGGLWKAEAADPSELG